MTASLLGLAAAAFAILAAIGSLYALVAAFLLRRFAAWPKPQATIFPGVSVLKPLHGAEEGLYDNLNSFCRQDYPGPLQVVFGLREPADPAASSPAASWRTCCAECQAQRSSSWWVDCGP